MARFKTFYASREWKKLRNWKFNNANGLCENCLKKGIITEGKEVHHIIPLDVDWNKRLDPDNLILLCPSCHDEFHQRDSQLQKFERFWDSLDDVDNNKQ